MILMLINGKISYQETEQLVFLLKDKITNSYLKKIYHYQGLWLFKFNHFQFVFEPGVSIWVGDFAERETNLHSISIKISSEITNTQSLGNVIYTDYIHLFQLSGMILLVAMIGAIVLTFRDRTGVKRQSYFKQISREKKDGVELVNPKSNKGVNIDA